MTPFWWGYLAGIVSLLVVGGGGLFVVAGIFDGVGGGMDRESRL